MNEKKRTSHYQWGSSFDECYNLKAPIKECHTLNLVEKLKDCPRGTVLYSPIYGDVRFDYVKNTGYAELIVVLTSCNTSVEFYPDGKYNTYYSDSEVLLFPARDQRDWAKFGSLIKPKFKKGNRIIDVVRGCKDVYEVLDVLGDKYMVTGFGELYFSDQDEFELAPVQIVMVEPWKTYWFIWEEGKTEPLMEKLLELIDAGYKPCGMKDGDIVYNVRNNVRFGRDKDSCAMIAVMFGTQLKIKENQRGDEV